MVKGDIFCPFSTNYHYVNMSYSLLSLATQMASTWNVAFLPVGLG